MNTRRILPLFLAFLLLGFPMTALRGRRRARRGQAGRGSRAALVPLTQTFRQWAQEQTLREGERGDRLETRQVVGQKLETVKLRNVVPPIHFESGVAKIPPDYVTKLTRILESMRYRKNVASTSSGTGFAALSEPLARQFGDNMGLSRGARRRGGRVFQEDARLPPEAITYEWVGDTQPVASNDTKRAGAQPSRRK